MLKIEQQYFKITKPFPMKYAKVLVPLSASRQNTIFSFPPNTASPPAVAAVRASASDVKAAIDAKIRVESNIIMWFVVIHSNFNKN